MYKTHLLCCSGIKWDPQHHQKYESNNLYDGSLQYQMSTQKIKNTIIDSTSTIVNQSLSIGTFPRKLENGWINKPINNLSFLSKMIETAAQAQLQKPFDNLSLLPKHKVHIDKILWWKQHCWICVKTSYKYGKSNMQISFFTVNHKILLDILQNCFGITEQALCWISSYLSIRTFLLK